MHYQFYNMFSADKNKTTTNIDTLPKAQKTTKMFFWTIKNVNLFIV